MNQLLLIFLSTVVIPGSTLKVNASPKNASPKDDSMDRVKAMPELASFWTHYDQLFGTGNWLGNYIPTQMEKYAQLVADPKIKTICETGFFKGMSALFYLAANPNATVHSFDIRFNANPQTIPYLKKHFGERLVTHPGFSTKTVPEFKEKCDIVSVDGDHGPGGMEHDVLNFQKNAHAGTILLSDDTFDPRELTNPCNDVTCKKCDCKKQGFTNACSQGWVKLVDETKVITQDECVDLNLVDDAGWPKGFCRGKFVKE